MHENGANDDVCELPGNKYPHGKDPENAVLVDKKGVSKMYDLPEYNKLTDFQKAACKKAAFLGWSEGIMLYDKNGRHCLTIVRCTDDCGFDWATPEGKVLHCDANAEDAAFVAVLGEIFGVSSLSE